MFASVLVANRGEIACRVIRTARAMGFRTVAVYSDADRDAPHVRQADAAARLGPAPVGESYLSIPALLDAARRTGAEAVHPGYGFLSENAGFAQACADAGLVFVGPPPAAIAAMGDKRQAKLLMEKAGVPVVPGYSGDDQAEARLVEEAARIGYPLMVKASAGGGGRGIRLVEAAGALKAALLAARGEAESAFGSGDLILERALAGARHVEVQVFADAHGGCIHLGERDCSLQRRRQKVIEESPSPAVSPALRRRMGEAAVAAAKAVGYVGAGTVEFLLAADGHFHFLEMNTRLQVEHPVTEAVTGLDLVAWQLRVAAGEPLPLEQDDVRFRGHAIEARLYAEDPAQGFLPQTGRVLRWRTPERVRVDAGIAEGQEVTPFYDPMLAKAIAHGATREDARRNLIAALERTALLGVRTNKAFLVQLLRDPVFAAGGATTAYMPDASPDAPDPRLSALAAALLARAGAWRSAGATTRRLTLGETAHEVGAESVDGVPLRILEAADGRIRFERDGVQGWAEAAWDDEGGLWLAADGATARFEEAKPRARARDARSDGRIVAPMAGRIVSVAEAGAAVARGEVVIVLEAMKMQHEIKAAAAGRLAEVRVAAGEQVGPRQLLALVVTEAS